MCGEDFTKSVLYYAQDWLPGRDIVERALNNAKEVHPSGEIIIMDNFCPWQSHLFDLEAEKQLTGKIKYALFEDVNKTWRVRAVSLSQTGFDLRKAMPESWRGLRDEQLASVSGIKDAVFCHASGFIAGTLSKEGAIQMAIKSLEN